jgi:glycosyltransferase involved in cell wall biosynthesis
VLHLHCQNVQAPKGPVGRRLDDAPTLRIEGLDIGEPFEKYAFGRRIRHERRYGRLVVEASKAFSPDVFVSSNVPLLTLAVRERWSRAANIPWVFWLQDIQSIAIADQARRRIPVAGHLAGMAFEHLEGRLLRSAHAVVAITDDFLPPLAAWNVPRERCTVIENWAPLDELGSHPRANRWAEAHDLVGRSVFLYGGTLGLKHNPSLLLALAEHLEARGHDAVVVVASDGLGADWLREHGSQQANLRVIGFQPFSDVPQMQASADVLLSILEPEAATFSVPSKVLNYLAVGRAVLAAIPAENRAARLINEIEAGLTVEPDDEHGFLAAADRLIDDPATRERFGHNARAYALDAFDITPIADRFERVFTSITPAPAD